MYKFSLDPVAKPRQTKSDKWKKRPSVMKYRRFADKLRFIERVTTKGAAKKILADGAIVVFHVPMPRSWSKDKQDRHASTPHLQKPDIDNLIKALLDALLQDDSNVHTIYASKRWARTGSIEICPLTDRNISSL